MRATDATSVLPPQGRERTGKALAWHAQSARLREDLGISPTCRIWTVRKGFAGEGLQHTERTRDILDIVAAKILASDSQAAAAQLFKNAYVDISQSHARLNWTRYSGVCGTMTTSTELYSFHHDRLC